MDDIIDLSMNIDDDDCVLESVTYNKNCIHNYDKMKKEEPLFTEFLEECLNLENSAEMVKIINQLFILKYKYADKNLKESSDFKHTLRKIINLLKTDPRNKYKHMKHLGTVLDGKPKRKVQLVTLESNPGKANKSVSIIENKKENNVLNTETNCNTSHDKPKQSKYRNENEHGGEDPLLVPHRVIDLESSKSENIQKIENEIRSYKDAIAKLDKAEVFTDSVNSPYIKSEKLKVKIVKLYEELCRLNGADPIKKKKVQLKVMEGHPAGPVKRLEMFLNKNIEYGIEPFPNFRDVVKCVLLANNEDRLGWSKVQIMQEATALFTYCGHALQKRRQRKEYQDLISMVSESDNDPADSDPELMAKLEANKQIAIKNENEVFQKFSMMQTFPNQINNNLSEDKNETELDVKIIKDPEMDIEELLNGLGDSFTTTVIDIEDSYLVIEIDSSDDE